MDRTSILVFVNHNVAVAFLVAVKHIGMLFKKLYSKPKQMVKIHSIISSHAIMEPLINSSDKLIMPNGAIFWQIIEDSTLYFLLG